jgi:hypothetical protein
LVLKGNRVVIPFLYQPVFSTKIEAASTSIIVLPMARRHPNEKILVQWTIDESMWRKFQGVMKSLESNPNGPYYTFTPPQEFPPSGIEVVIRDDAVFIERKCVLEYVYEGGFYGMSVHESLLMMRISSDSDVYVYLLPIAPAAILDAERVIGEFTAADKEEARIRTEEAARPTLRNRLLWWIEAHFILTIIIIFFGIIPLFALAAHYLSLLFGWG